MNARKIHHVIQMRSAITLTDLIFAHVILDIVEMDLPARVRLDRYWISYVKRKHAIKKQKIIKSKLLDLYECQNSPCHSNAMCNNTEGSYTCKCDSGFSGDGFNCIGKFTKINIDFKEVRSKISRYEMSQNHRSLA